MASVSLDPTLNSSYLTDKLLQPADSDGPMSKRDLNLLNKLWKGDLKLPSKFFQSKFLA